jgi:UDP-N-acetyl-D-mannosaminuronic acid dehydrogenase
VPLEQAIEQADVIVLGAPHSAYRDLHFPDGKKVIDVWGFWRCEQEPVNAAKERR